MVRALGGRTFQRVGGVDENPRGKRKERETWLAFVLRTTNDVNGNSRRLLLVIDPVREAILTMKVGPEGVRGAMAELDTDATVIHVNTIEVTPHYYRSALSHAVGVWWYY